MKQFLICACEVQLNFQFISRCVTLIAQTTNECIAA